MRLYISPVRSEILRLQEEVSPLNVLEVGCGNGTNLKILRDSVGTGVNLCGVDIASNRIKVGQEYWGDAIAEVEFYTMDATDLRQFQTGQFDLAFSVCALEQMTYRLHEAVRELVRVSSRLIVCVEPLPEHGNTEQRLYNLVNDQCRTLIQELNATELMVEDRGLLPVLHNPLNPVGLVLAFHQ